MTHVHSQILPQGTQIGVYEIKKATKAGNFDITYRAWNHHLKEYVEILEYFPDDLAIRKDDGLGVAEKTVDEKESFEYGLKAFLNQGEALAQIEHPNVATAENTLQFNGTAYLIMRCYEGVPLSRLIQSSTTFSETEIKFILTSILNALQTIHDHGIVHGGIRPETIWLNKEGEPLLVDFAGARLAIAARTDRAADELAACYAPAEQYEGAAASGPATDFYALGATMYYCMTHQLPATAQSRIIAINKGGLDPLVSLSQYSGTTFDTELVKAIDWMLQPQSTGRPQSAAEILTLLNSEQTGNKATPINSAQVSRDTASDHSGSKKYLWVGSIIGIVALISVGLWLSESTSDNLFDDNDASISVSKTAPNQSTTLASAPSNRKADSNQIAENDKQLETNQITESASASADLSTTQPEHADTITTEPKSNTGQPSTVTEKSSSQSEAPDIAVTMVDNDLIDKHLTAAKNAIKHDRLTTPSSDNAYKYYQMVLAMDPDNAQALSGLKKIVDRYIQFIESTKSRGELDTAKLYLQRAESVLPDNPKLQSIRKELAAAD